MGELYISARSTERRNYPTSFSKPSIDGQPIRYRCLPLHSRFWALCIICARKEHGEYGLERGKGREERGLQRDEGGRRDGESAMRHGCNRQRAGSL